jgi:hypothetical protein
LAIGDAITQVRLQMRSEKGLGLKYTFSGSVYFDRMKKRHLYSTEVKQIAERVDKAGLSEIFATEH